MYCGKRELAINGSNTLFIGGSQIWGSLKIVIFFGGQKENVSNKENSPSLIRDFINERSLKLTKILNLNLLKFDFTVQAQSRIIKTESIFLFPQKLKFNLKTTFKTTQ